MAELSELLAKLDADSQVRGCQFEHICKWYLENDPKYRLELKKVWLWNDWPGRWGPDAGIDLVAKTYDNKLWAIQAKAYDEKYSIKKADIDTFLSESSRQVFSYRLLITTTNFIGRTAERTLHDQEKPVGRVLLSDLEKSQLEWPDSPEKLEAKPLKRKKPQPHQHKAISDVLKGFSNNERGQLIMACGTGKTLVALWVAEKLQSQRTLILLPSLSLLAQTLREWTINSSESFHYLPVCSDDTVRGADHLVSRTSDLGLPVTTHSDEVAAFLRKRGHVVVFSTYQSSPVIVEAFTREHVPAFDLVIADEAHRCAGHGSGPFATILDATAVKAKRRLFMTATPRYFTDHVRKEAKVVDFEIASMDDENKFGPLFHQLSFSEAIRQDLLSDYQVVIVGVDDPTYHRYAEQGTFVTTDGKEVTDARTLASQIALAKAIRKYKLRRVVSFHGRIKRAKEFSEQLPDVIDWIPEDSRPIGDLWSKHVSGEMPSGRRDALLNRFRHLEDGERGLLTNARCLGEGIDLPTLDGVAFIDPRSSQIEIVQAVGRAIRKATKKKIATVVLPVFINSDQDCEVALDSSVFKPVWDVLKALRAHDDVLAETLDQLRRQLGHYGNKTFALPQKLFIDLPVTVGKAFAESLKVRLVERATASWEFWFALLETYVEAHGTALVPSKYVTENGLKLGAWILAQRQIYRQGKLQLRRQQALEKLPGWVWNTVDAKWQKSFECLWKYVQVHGDALVPQGYCTEGGFHLGSWFNSQRGKCRNGQLSVEKRQMLERVPGWTLDPYHDAWQEGIEELKEYVKRGGNALVPAKYKTKAGFALGRWVRRRRWDYSEGKLPPEKQKVLEKLPGWSWGPRKKAWQEGFEHLQDYVDRKGSGLVPSDYIANDGYKLGCWVVKQRGDYRKGKLSLEEQQAFEELPEWAWDKKEAVWLECLAALREYAEREGNTLVPRNYFTKHGYNLGTWVTSRRRDFKLGKLTFERQRLLERIPGWVWDTLEAAWTRGFDYLLKHVKREGDTLVPHGYITDDGYKLGQWVQQQRQCYKLGKLSAERQQNLEQLPGWMWKRWELKRTKWQNGLASLRDYVQYKGDALVPAKYETVNGFRLGQWVRLRRKDYQDGKLSSERQKVLEQLPGWNWRPHKKAWQEGFEYLHEYVDHKGSALVSSKYVANDGYKLGAWVHRQRFAYRKGKLSTKKQMVLEQLPGWTWDTNKPAWIEAFTHLREYVKRKGDAIVPQSYVTENGYKLGSWIARQRRVYRQGKLFKERQKALEQMPGWTWEPHLRPRLDDARWRECFKLLKEYVGHEGHAFVPARYVTEDGCSLGSWVARQRQDYRERKLPKKRELVLRQLPHWTWDPLESAWLRGFKYLQEYAECQNHTLVTVSYITQDGYNLGIWVRQQRSSYRRGKLSTERQEALEQLPGWVWNPRKTPAKTKD